MQSKVIIAAVTFGLGVALLFFGLSMHRKSSRFSRDLYQERRSRVLGIFKPLRYTHLGKMLFQAKQKSLGLVEMEDLLNRAGHPYGLTPAAVQTAMTLLPVIALISLISYYGGTAFITAAKRLLTAPSLPFTEVRSSGLTVLIILAVGVLAYFLPVYILKYIAWVRENKVKEEQGPFTEIVFTLLRVKQPLRVALEEAGKTTDFLRPYIQVCLNEWPTDRFKAMQNLKKNVGVARFDVVIDLLIQTASIGDDKIADFLEENKKLEDELTNISISAKSKVRPLVMTFQMLIPLFIVFLVLFYPAMQQVRGLLSSFLW